MERVATRETCQHVSYPYFYSSRRFNDLFLSRCEPLGLQIQCIYYTPVWGGICADPFMPNVSIVHESIAKTALICLGKESESLHLFILYLF